MLSINVTSSLGINVIIYVRNEALHLENLTLWENHADPISRCNFTLMTNQIMFFFLI